MNKEQDKWDCKYYVYEESWGGEEEYTFSGCSHIKMDGSCILEYGKKKCAFFERD